MGCAMLAAGAVALAGCAEFTEQPSADKWTSQPKLTPLAGPRPELPGEQKPGGSQRPTSTTAPRPPEGCTDYNPLVIATCLDTVSAIAALPGDGSNPMGLVGERRTGRILRVQRGVPPVVVATVPVDRSGDGGLTGLALSPTYAEDQLIFAYVTTASDNRLVRIAPKDTPKPVLTGIPKGPVNNRGALALDHRGALLLATGDAGNPAAAADPNSLAGKVLRLDGAGRPARGNPNPSSPVITSGLRAPGGVCASMEGARTWVTDRGADRDLLYRIEAGRPLTGPAWTWPDRPGVAGCASTPASIAVATSIAGDLQTLPLAADGTLRGKPEISMKPPEGFGRLGGMDLIADQVAMVGTVNKDGGTPVSSDDRAFLLVIQGGGGSGPD
ncbi:glucose/sorbosone dehydrogenase [Herbihabitans rhizosphaerae]|uniref:Glucose/sorbosone dehydrogenase n=1 Tax=Herbihabitans rhizosphaerae TaxID=1872711 RepID=A0A4Q7KRE5_9PSEU|nr:glucose/sorbosone dehydrogenase [Herbihabitans rhizosphaerae]